MPSMKSMGLIDFGKTFGNESTNQRPAFDGESLEHDNIQ